MKIILILFFLFLSCQQNGNKHSDENKTHVNSQDNELKANVTKPKIESKNSILIHDSLFYRLYVIKYHDQARGEKNSRDFTLFDNSIDTSFAFNFQLRKDKFSRKIEYFVKDNHLRFSSHYVNDGLFYLKEIKDVNDTLQLGIFVEYFGFERICYAYGLLKVGNNGYTIDRMFSKMDITGIGEIKFEDHKIFNDSSFYYIGNNQQEGYQTIAIHYFPKNMKNETFLLEKCFPSAEANPHSEKLEYSFDSNQNSINIVKSEIDYDKENVWRIISKNRYNIVDIIKSKHTNGIK